MEKKILFIEICDYHSVPVGGYLSFAKQMIAAFGPQLFLVGSSLDEGDPIGKWFIKEINDVKFNYFSVKKKSTNKKTLLPQRFINYMLIKFYKKRILFCGLNNVFVQTPEVLLALNLKRNYNVCVRVPGLRNPLSISRYRYAKYLEKLFDIFTSKAYSKSNIVLATGDKNELEQFKIRNKYDFNQNLIQFPSRIDTEKFKRLDSQKAKIKLGLDTESVNVLVSGRLSSLKGWRLIIDSFKKFNLKITNSQLFFIGDGEDYDMIKNYIKKNSLEKSVKLLGRKNHNILALYLNAGDLYVAGSFVEGWSTSLMEAISCGLPAVVTNFSSAKELVKKGENGFVIEDRDSSNFSKLMIKAVNLEKESLIKHSNEMKKYCTSKLKSDILNLWQLK